MLRSLTKEKGTQSHTLTNVETTGPARKFWAAAKNSCGWSHPALPCPGQAVPGPWTRVGARKNSGRERVLQADGKAVSTMGGWGAGRGTEGKLPWSVCIQNYWTRGNTGGWVGIGICLAGMVAQRNLSSEQGTNSSLDSYRGFSLK